MRSKATSVVRASAMPWPSIAASISMLARLRTGPGMAWVVTLAASNHRPQFVQSSSRRSGNFTKSDAHHPFAATDKLGTAHRKQLLGAKPPHLKFRPSPIAVANGEVDIFAREVDALVARGHAEVDLWMALGEPAKPTDEPLRREIRRDADGEHAGALPLRQTFGAERYLIERVADYGEILAARFGDDEPLALAIKELEPELGFERLHLLAYRSRCHEQLRKKAPWKVGLPRTRKRALSSVRSNRSSPALVRRSRP